MKNPSDYPYKNYIRIGWSAPNKKPKKVDFAGHSWFLKKNWLHHMFEGTEKLQAYKCLKIENSVSSSFK